MEDFEVGTVVWQHIGNHAIGVVTPTGEIKVITGVAVPGSWWKFPYTIPREIAEEIRRLRSKWTKEKQEKVTTSQGRSDGSSADYYKLPEGCTQLQDLISHRDMNAQVGEIFRAMYRYGQASHSDQLRDAKKVKFYIEAEIARLEKSK